MGELVEGQIRVQRARTDTRGEKGMRKRNAKKKRGDQGMINDEPLLSRYFRLTKEKKVGPVTGSGRCKCRKSRI